MRDGVVQDLMILIDDINTNKKIINFQDYI